MKIGIFDSGFGGLMVLHEVKARLPQYDYVYLGDNARAPYGNRNAETIYEYSKQAMDFLFGHGCQLVIVACNTISATALRKLQNEYLPALKDPTKRILGVLIPLAEEIMTHTRTGRIGLIGTKATIQSGSFEKELQKQFEMLQKSGTKFGFQRLNIYKIAAPLLVPLIEEGWAKHAVTNKVLRVYLRPLKDKKIDTLIVGCTHYILLHRKIERMIGRRVFVPQAAKIVAEKFSEYLSRHPEIESRLSQGKTSQIYTTDDSRRVNDIGSKFFFEPLKSKHISLSYPT